MMLSELFPFPRGPPQSVTKPEFINMLRNLGLNMSTEELDKLWKRYTLHTYIWSYEYYIYVSMCRPMYVLLVSR